jgi:alpha-1,2-mannosyltransferase
MLDARAGAQAQRTATRAVIAGAVVLALALRVFLLTRPGQLLGVTEYDDGPYFGSALRLLQGIMPYRDFVLVQPPGITLLMVPAALLAKLTGTAGGMAVGRILTMLASVAAVVLVGLLVRHRGVLATLIACGIVATYPASVTASHTVLVEPWLVLFCLIGAVAVFDGDRLATSRGRLACGGLAFGLGGAVEGWAIMPVLAVTALALATSAAAPGLWPRVRRAAVYAGGVAAGFLVPVVPFAMLFPHGFYQSLIVAQVGPRAQPQRVGVWDRFHSLLGVTGVHLQGTAPVLLAALAVVALAVGAPVLAWILTRRLPSQLEAFALATAVLVTGMFLWPDQFHYHFAAFLAPFLAMAIALPTARLAEAVLATRALQHETWLHWFIPGLAGLVIAGFAVLGLSAETSPGAGIYVQMKPGATAVVGQMQRLVPPGACVLTDQASWLIIANRFSSGVPGCSPMVDTLGTDLALSGGLKPATGAGHDPAVAAVWRSAFSHAQFVWLTYQNGHRVPWTRSLRAYFHKSFVAVLNDGQGDVLYRRAATR